MMYSPLQEDLNTPEYIAKLHSLYLKSSKGNKSSKKYFYQLVNKLVC